MGVFDDLITLRFRWLYNLYSETLDVEGWTIEECFVEAIKEMKHREWEDGFVFVEGHVFRETALLGRPRFGNINRTI